jgi:hypothetical protein
METGEARGCSPKTIPKESGPIEPSTTKCGQPDRRGTRILIHQINTRRKTQQIRGY